MFKNLDIFRMAQDLAVHSSARQSVIAQNMANADTPGYAARDIAPFEATLSDDAPGFAPRATRAGHMGSPTATSGFQTYQTDGDASSPNGNSVSLELEMLKSVDVKRQHDRALAIYKSSLRVLRSAIGRQ